MDKKNQETTKRKIIQVKPQKKEKKITFYKLFNFLSLVIFIAFTWFMYKKIIEQEKIENEIAKNISEQVTVTMNIRDANFYNEPKKKVKIENKVEDVKNDKIIDENPKNTEEIVIGDNTQSKISETKNEEVILTEKKAEKKEVKTTENEKKNIKIEVEKKKEVKKPDPKELKKVETSKESKNNEIKEKNEKKESQNLDIKTIKTKKEPVEQLTNEEVKIKLNNEIKEIEGTYAP